MAQQVNGCRVQIVADMAWSHDGCRGLAERIVRGASEAGADMVNIHLTSLPDYMVRHYGSGAGRVSHGKESESVYNYLEGINLSGDDWRHIAEVAQGVDLSVSALCNDRESVRFAHQELSVDAFVIHPSSIHEERLVRDVSSQGKRVFLYIGGLWLGEVERALEWCRAESNDNVVLQYGFQSYPTQPEEANLGFIKTLSTVFALPVAYADHTGGDSPLALIMPLLAIAAGATIIEKHLTHDRFAKGEDHEAALNPDELKTLVEWVREVELAMGSPSWRPLSERELAYREAVRKRAVAARDLTKGERVRAEDVAYKRADEGLFPDQVWAVLDRTLPKSLKKDDSLTTECFDEDET